MKVRKGEQALTPQQVAEILQRSVKTLEDWRYHGRGPKYFRLGYQGVRYWPADIDQWIKDGGNRRQAS